MMHRAGPTLHLKVRGTRMKPNIGINEKHGERAWMLRAFQE